MILWFTFGKAVKVQALGLQMVSSQALLPCAGRIILRLPNASFQMLVIGGNTLDWRDDIPASIWQFICTLLPPPTLNSNLVFFFFFVSDQLLLKPPTPAPRKKIPLNRQKRAGEEKGFNQATHPANRTTVTTAVEGHEKPPAQSPPLPSL